MILANGCNITKSEKCKGVWILSVPTVYIYIYIYICVCVCVICANKQPYHTAMSVILHLYICSMAWVCKYIRNNNGVSLKNTLLCRTTSFRHGFKYQVDSLTAEPKSPLLNPKHHFRTSNEGTLSCFIDNLLYYNLCIKSNVLCRVEY